MDGAIAEGEQLRTEIAELESSLTAARCQAVRAEWSSQQRTLQGLLRRLDEPSDTCSLCSVAFRVKESTRKMRPRKLRPEQLEAVGAREFLQLYRSMFETKRRQRPVLMVMYGPPGSGKTTILGKVMKRYYNNLDNYAVLSVDSMLLKIAEYRKEMAHLNASRHELCGGKATCGPFFNRSQETYKRRFRPVVDLWKHMLADIAFREDLGIVYETTGSKLPGVIDMIDHARQEGYIVQLIFPFVEARELSRRVQLRNRNQPRALRPNTALDMRRSAMENFPRVVERADRVYVYDNNGPRSAPLRPLFHKTMHGGTRCDLDDYPELVELLRDLC